MLLRRRDGLFRWKQWEERAGGTPEQASEVLRAVAKAAHARRHEWEHVAAEQLQHLDLYRNGAPLRALRAHCNGRSVAAGLMISSLLESFVKRQLPVKWYEDSAVCVPHRIAQLIADDRFQCFSPAFRFWFIAIIGPAPTGLNLRNILWHGFGSSDFAPHSTSLLFCFALSTAELFGACAVVDSAVVDVEHVLRRSGASFLCAPVDWRHVVDRSFFVFPGMQELLLEGSDDEDMHLCCVVAVIEQSLRQVYAFATGSSAALLTATDSLMTTMDFFIEHGGPQFVYLVGENILEELRDLFVAQNGPKIRDLMSHGACDVARMPSRLVNCIHHVLLRLMLRFQIGGARVEMPPYVSHLSPVAVCQRMVRNCADLLNALRASCASRFPEAVPGIVVSENATATRRCVVLLTEIAFLLFRRSEHDAAVGIVTAAACILFAWPNQVLASVVLTCLRKNKVARIVSIMAIYLGLPVAQGDVSKRERTLFQDNFQHGNCTLDIELCRSFFRAQT